MLSMLFIGYTLEVVRDARDYADHAGRADIGMDDVRLAVRKKQDALSAGPPTREVRWGMAPISQALNSKLTKAIYLTIHRSLPTGKCTIVTFRVSVSV